MARVSQRVLEVKNWTDGIPLTNICINGVNYENWSITGVGTEKSANGIKMVQADGVDSAFITLTITIGMSYALIYTVSESTLAGRLITTSVGSFGSFVLTKTAGMNIKVLTATTSNNKIFLALDSDNTNGQYILFSNIMLCPLIPFGTGLEPTAAQLLAMLTASGITYFDGTRNISLAGYTRTIDRSRSQLHGTLSGGAAYKYISGMPLHVLDFTGSTSLCTIPKNAAINDMTQFSWCGWFHYTGTMANYGAIFSKNQKLFYLNHGTNALVFNHTFSTGTGGWTTDANTLILGNYYHMVLTYDNSSTTNNAVIYIDGVSKTVTSTSPTGTASLDNSNDLIFGNNSGGSRYLNGYLSEVTIQRGIMTEAEVRRLFNSQCLKYGKVQI